MIERPFEYEVELERLAAIVESSDDAIISKSLDGIIRSWNAGATKIFAYTSEEMIGQSINRIIPPDLQDEELAILSRLRAGERIDHFDTVRLAKDGRRVDISITVSPLRNDRGEIVGASKVARDVTERKRSEATQRLLINELNHRVKNTLAMVQSIASQSLASSEDPSAFMDCFSGRLQAISRAHDLLVREKMEGIHLHELMSLELDAQPGALLEGVSLEGPDVLIKGSLAVHMMLIIHELMTNALKYGALSQDSGRLSVRWEVKGSWLKLRWQESGVESPEPSTRKGFGTTLIEKTMQANNGWASRRYTEDGINVVLELQLPCLSRAPRPVMPGVGRIERKPETLPPQLDGLHALIVEDEAIIAMDVQMKLEQLGCETVDMATTLEEAHALLEEKAPDLVLLDANLHGMPVDSLAQLLSERGIPFLFASGYGREALPEAHRNADFVSKPFTDAKLATALTGLLARREKAR